MGTRICIGIPGVGYRLILFDCMTEITHLVGFHATRVTIYFQVQLCRASTY